jgi:hypothetical protein
VAVLVAGGTADWALAAQTYGSWADATSFVASLRPLAARAGGGTGTTGGAGAADMLIFASAQKRVAQYYTPQGEQWWRWEVTGLPLDPAWIPRAGWASYYRARLRESRYDLIALFYARPASMVLPGGPRSPGPPGPRVRSALLRLPSLKPSEPGVPTLTRALAGDSGYRLVAVGPYDSDVQPGVFAIWQRMPTSG